jgi:hypothetical protein
VSHQILYVSLEDTRFRLDHTKAVCVTLSFAAVHRAAPGCPPPAALTLPLPCASPLAAAAWPDKAWGAWQQQTSRPSWSMQRRRLLRTSAALIKAVKTARVPRCCQRRVVRGGGVGGAIWALGLNGSTYTSISTTL